VIAAYRDYIAHNHREARQGVAELAAGVLPRSEWNSTPGATGEADQALRNAWRTRA
jgi:hypothetical protein